MVHHSMGIYYRLELELELGLEGKHICGEEKIFKALSTHDCVRRVKYLI